MRKELKTENGKITIPKENWRCLNSKVCKTAVIAICENCGTELYAVWDEFNFSMEDRYPLRSSLFQRYKQDNFNASEVGPNKDFEACLSWGEKHNSTVKQEKGTMFPKYAAQVNDRFRDCPITCPICNQKINNELYSNIYRIERNKDFDATLSHEFDYLYRCLDRVDTQTSLEKVTALVSSFNHEMPDNDFSKTTVAEIKNSPEYLQQFIFELIRLEANIYSVTERLKTLLSLKTKYQRKMSIEKVDLEEQKHKNIVALETSVSNLEAELNLLVNSLSPEKLGIVQPQKPQKPSEPIFKTPGLLNKKKVAEENARILSEHDKKMMEYQGAFRSYEEEYDVFLKELENKRQQFREEHSDALKEAQKKLIDAKAVNNDTVQLEHMPSGVAKNLIQNEIDEATDLLQRLIHTKTAYYNTNIVFQKYQNMVALTTFYEYLLSGRCSKLEGADGAYNIYEQEIRADRIIAKLDDILKALENIQQNQYMLYSIMRDVNENLRNLNRTTDLAVNSLQRIEDTTARIEYNAEETAYYSKKNAELTNALGFMIALK